MQDAPSVHTRIQASRQSELPCIHHDRAASMNKRCVRPGDSHLHAWKLVFFKLRALLRPAHSYMECGAASIGRKDWSTVLQTNDCNQPEPGQHSACGLVSFESMDWIPGTCSPRDGKLASDVRQVNTISHRFLPPGQEQRINIALK